MNLPRPAMFGIIAAAVAAVIFLGYSLIQSNRTTLSEAEERQRQAETEQSYRKAMQAGDGPSIYTEKGQMPAATSTSAAGDAPSIYQDK